MAISIKSTREIELMKEAGSEKTKCQARFRHFVFCSIVKDAIYSASEMSCGA